MWMVPHKGFLSQADSFSFVSTDLSRGGHQEMTLGLFGNKERDVDWNGQNCWASAQYPFHHTKAAALI